MRIYISGKITGLQFNEVEQKFRSCEHFLLSSGHETVNPLKIRPFLGFKKYWCYMISDLFNLLFCDAIFLLNDWSESRGAKIEKQVAEFIGMKIIFDN